MLPLLFLLLALPAHAQVSDGDTFRSQGARVRLACIDAPESDQPYGQEAKQRLQELLTQPHHIEIVDTDRYGRQVARVWLGRTLLQETLVREGMAWVYPQFRHHCPDDLLRAQAQAQQQRLGLWADPNPIPPWEWRKNPSPTPTPTNPASSSSSTRSRPLTIKLELRSLQHLKVREGDTVEAGDLIALDKERHQLLEAQIALLEQPESQPEPDYQAQARLRELEYQALERQYQSQYNRVQTLLSTPSVPPRIREQEIQTLQNLYSQLQLAHERLAQAQQQAQHRQLTQEAERRQRQAELNYRLQSLRQELAQTETRSPLRGTVKSIQIQEQKNQTLYVQIQILPH